MSTILKALRRLEEEKSRGGSSRPLREEVASGPGELQTRRWTLWIPVLALLIGAGVGASAWWLWPYERTFGAGEDVAAAAPPAAEPAAQLDPVAAAPVLPDAAPTPPPVGGNDPSQLVLPDLAQPAPQPQDASELAAALRDPGMPDDAWASEVAVVDRPEPAPRIEPAPEPAPAVAPPPAPVAQQQTPALAPQPRPGEKRPGPLPGAENLQRTKLARAESKTAPAPAPERVAPVERAAVASEPEPDFNDFAEPEPAPKPAPPRETASAPVPVVPGPVVPAARSTSAASDEIYVTRTQWHPERARRSADVRIDGQSRSVHEGDKVAGYEVSEIRPSGVVLTRDGERIEQKIGKPRSN